METLEYFLKDWLWFKTAVALWFLSFAVSMPWRRG